jgi:SAM-dependent methyltransferase
MFLRYHEIAEADRRILNPISAAKLQLLGEVCDLEAGMRVLDLACGKGEMLAQWAHQYDVRGVGVDISADFLHAAEERAFVLDVGNKLHFVQGDAAQYPEAHHEFDIVTCLGATWIGGGLAGTLDLMREALAPTGGRLVVGEVFWLQPPTPEIAAELDYEVDTFVSLADTLARFEVVGLELIEMVLADQDDFDRYEASQWRTVHNYLNEHPDDPEYDDLKRWIDTKRRRYLHYGRDYMGWGVFVLSAPAYDKVAVEQPEKVVASDRPVGIKIDEERLWVHLQDGRIIANPIAWYPWLRDVTPALRDEYEIADGWIRWPSLNRQISIEALLSGRP